jgi:uncharacterized membrane protein SpoIIM required for sporulation
MGGFVRDGRPDASSTQVPRSVAFRRDRQRNWSRLELLIGEVERRGIRSLGEKELVELPTLHRAAVSALSVARAISLDRALLEYLEDLTARSHFCVYGVRRRWWRSLVEFFAVSFPSALRAARWQFVLAAIVLLVGVITGFALTASDMELYESFVPAGMSSGRDPSASTEYLRSTLYAERSFAEGLSVFASFLFQHNTQVGILCFALGFAIGIPVLWLLFYNGLMLGAMSALFHDHGLSLDWWGWILPHGVTELLAIVLCGTAGLLQGHAVLLPGRRSRIAALRSAGRPAGTIVLGSVLLFFVAALLEGFFRQLVHSVSLRYAVATFSALIWICYFSLAGRRVA